MKFRELLKKKDLHGAQLARRVGCDRSLVSCWVRGTAKPTIDRIPKIAEALNVDIAEVVACFTDKEEV